MKLDERLLNLKERCLACWAVEFRDIFPQHINKELASNELRKCGNPSCKCNPKDQPDEQ